MKHFIDASILVEACLAESRHFTAADGLVKRDVRLHQRMRWRKRMRHFPATRD